MTTAPLDTTLASLSIATALTPSAPLAAPAAPRAMAYDRACLARAGLVYVALEALAAWGWLHWRADMPTLAPSLAVTMLMRGAFLLLFVSAVAQAGARSRHIPGARDAACIGVAALLLHAPWTLIVLKWPQVAGVWLAAMAATAIAATARLGRDQPSAALIAAPYTAWLVCTLFVDMIAAHGRG
ncbi:MAG: hypothetical protein KJS97_10780 [Alphaproteobacteria bacterium]|nr:hypothetical protein [Alphaproteobacteria bacterium]